MGCWFSLAAMLLLAACAAPPISSLPVAESQTGTKISPEAVPKEPIAALASVEAVAPVVQRTGEAMVAMDVKNSVFFARGSAVLSAEMESVIRTVVDMLKAERSFTVLLVGYSGHWGSREISLALALQRVDVVEKELLRHGVQRSQIRKHAKGYLKSVLTKCRGGGCDRQLQRVELRLADKKGRELEWTS